MYNTCSTTASRSVAKAKPGPGCAAGSDDWQARDLASESNLEAVQGNLDTARSEVAVAQGQADS